MEGPRKVTLARFSAMGDVAMVIPALYDACLSHPGTEFTLLTRAPFHKIFVNAPANLNVRAVDLRGRYRGLRGMARLARETDADVFVDLHSVLRTHALGIFLKLKGIPTVRFDKARREKRRVVKGREGEVSPTLARYRSALERAGVAGESRFAPLFPKTAHDGPRRVGIAPFAAHPGKVYPPEKMRRVAEMLAARGYALTFFGGGEREREILGRWAAEIPGAQSAVGLEGGFAAEMQVMADLDCMVAMDSGNMHLAALCGTPVVSVWGATRPVCGFAPYQAPGVTNTAICAPADCAPCSVFGNRPCRYHDMHCMDTHPEDIVNEVVKTVEK